MAEENGNEAQAALARLQKRVDEHDTEFVALRSIVRDLTDAMVVHAHLEKVQTKGIAENKE